MMCDSVFGGLSRGLGCVRRGKSVRMSENSLAGVRGRIEGLGVVAMEEMIPCTLS